MREDQKKIASKNTSSGLDVTTGLLGSGLNVFAGGDKSTATLTVQRDFDGGDDKTLSFHSFTIEASAPLNKSTDTADFITESGLPSNPSLTAAYTGTMYNETGLPATEEERGQFQKEAITNCLNTEKDESIKKQCKENKVEKINWKKYLSEDKQNKLKDEFDTTTIWLYGVSGTVGYQKYEYRDTADFSEQDQHEVPFSVSAYMGVSPTELPLYFGLGYTYKEQYIDAKEQTLCQPSDGNSPQECFTDSFSIPNENKDSVVHAVGRVKSELSFSEDGSKKLLYGVELKLAYDVEDEVFGVSLPIYLVPDKESGLRGGVKATWDDEDNEIEYGVFVGSTFNLF